MRNNTAYLSSRVVALIAAALFLIFSPLPALAQDDAKDLEIARLKSIVETQQKQIDILLLQQKAIQERLVKEIETLNKAFRDRDAMIAILELEKKALRLEAVQQEARAKAASSISERLLEQIRELEAKLARLQGGEKVEPAKPRDENSNPPAVIVNGKIEKIDGDLIQINLGTDQGVEKNHTLDVYRLAPEAKYLGRIRVVDATKSQAVGRLVGPAPIVNRPALMVGDLVTSSLNFKK